MTHKPTNLPRHKRAGQRATRGSAKPGKAYHAELGATMMARSKDIADRIHARERAEADAAIDAAVRRADEALAAVIDPAEVAALQERR